MCNSDPIGKRQEGVDMRSMHEGHGIEAVCSETIAVRWSAQGAVTT